MFKVDSWILTSISPRRTNDFIIPPMVYEDSVFLLILRKTSHYLYLCFANINRTKVHIVKALIFPVVMYRYES